MSNEKRPAIPEEIREKLLKTIDQLKNLEDDLLLKKEHILQQNKKIDDRINHLSKIDKTIKINHKHRSMFQNDCNNYVKSIDNVLNKIEVIVQDIRKALNPTAEQLNQLKDFRDFIVFTAHLELRATDAKKFIKQVKKEIAVSHSRFSFSFDEQNKQLSYLEGAVRTTR